MKADTPAVARGFTLVETVTSLTLLALAGAAIGGLLVSHLRLESRNANRTTAISLAARELEDLRSLDYNSIPASRTSTKTVGGLRYTIASTAAFDVPALSMATIATTVSWTEPLGSQSYAAHAIYTDVTR